MIEAEWGGMRRTNSPRDIFYLLCLLLSVEFG